MANERDYSGLAAQLDASGDRAMRMRRFVDAAWERLAATGVSWIGFYVHSGGDELVLACCRNKPACSPIAMHGACGRSFRDRAALLIHDVRSLGAGYIACDPRDQSELVLPLMDATGACWGVLDADSYEIGAFDEGDVAGMSAALRAGGLLGDDVNPTRVIRV